MLAWPNVEVECMCVGNGEKYLEIITTDWRNATFKNRQLLCFNPPAMCACVLLCFQCYILCPCKVPWWEGHREFAWVWEGGLCLESTVAHIFKIVTLLTPHFKLCAYTNPIQGHCWSTSRRVWHPWIEVRLLLVLRTEDDSSVFSLKQANSESVG